MNKNNRRNKKKVLKNEKSQALRAVIKSDKIRSVNRNDERWNT